MRENAGKIHLPAAIASGVMVFCAVMVLVARQLWLERETFAQFEGPAAIAGILFRSTEGWWSSVAMLSIALSPLLPFPGQSLLTWGADRKWLLGVSWILFISLVFLGMMSAGFYPWSADEYCARWQAKVFASGAISASYPVFWEGRLSEISHFLHPLVGTAQGWTTGYLPGYALMLTPFIMVGVPWLLNPLLTLLGAWILDRIMFRLGITARLDRTVALLLYASSGQILACAGTQYAMPAHLTLNLLWLLLFLQAGEGRLGSLILLPLVGACALLLHKPFHAIFVLPFLFRMLRARSWLSVSWVMGIYVVAWLLMRTWNQRIGMNYEREIPYELTHGFHREGLLGLIQFISWQPLVAAFAVVAVSRWRELPTVLRDLAWGIAFTAILTALRNDGQGHGWGSRYLHPVLGSLIILATWGWSRVKTDDNMRDGICRMMVTGVLVGIALSLVRLCVVSAWVTPYRQAAEHLRSYGTDLVVVNMNLHWLARDLRRNDPWLALHPVVVMATADYGQELPTGTITRIGPKELDSWGVPRTSTILENN